MSLRVRVTALLLLLGWGLLPCAVAQPVDASAAPPPPAYVSQLDGPVTLTRNASSETPIVNAPVLEGDRVSTADGRIAVQWPDGTLFAADKNVVFDVVEGSRVRLLRGRVFVVVPASAADAASELRIVTANAVVEPRAGARYVVAVDQRDWRDATVVEVDEGSVLLTADGGALPVEAAQMAAARGSERPLYLTGSGLLADTDGGQFREWAMAAAGDLAEPAPATAAYLPPDLQVYGATLQRYGTWATQGPEGWVWYPQVAVGWTPYSVGTWVQAGYYGWVWAGVERWSWPTHHYGRWGWHDRRGWYWRPAAAWAPAHVWWAIGPSYVSWCALDWTNRPIMPSPFWTYDHDLYRVNQHWRPGRPPTPWRGWTVVPSRSFGGRTPVQRVAVEGWTLPQPELRAFVTQARPPVRRAGGAVYVAAAPGHRYPSNIVGPVDDSPRAPAERSDAGSGRMALPVGPRATERYPAQDGESWGDRRDDRGPGDPGAQRQNQWRYPETDQQQWQQPVYVTPGWPWRAPYRQAPDPNAVRPAPYDRTTPFINPRWTSPLPGSSGGGVPRLRDQAPTSVPLYPPYGAADRQRSPSSRGGEEGASYRGGQPSAPRDHGAAGAGGVADRIPAGARSRSDGGSRQGGQGGGSARPRR